MRKYMLLFFLNIFLLSAEQGENSFFSLNNMEGIQDGKLEGNTFYYTYEQSKVYEIYTAPGKITALILQEGEKIIHPPALGEVSFFSVGAVNAYYKGRSRQQLHIKALQSKSSTNLILNTNKRSYFLLLRTNPFSYMNAVAWHYSGSELDMIIEDGYETNSSKDSFVESVTDTLNFRYELVMARGKRPSWYPIRVFDDGQKTYIQFPNAAQILEVPVLFVLSSGELNVVSYRIEKEYYVYDSLFKVAELRTEGKRKRDSVVVRIVRQ